MPTYFKIPFHKSISDGNGKVVGVYPQVSNSPGESSSARACYDFHNKNPDNHKRYAQNPYPIITDYSNDKADAPSVLTVTYIAKKYRNYRTK